MAYYAQWDDENNIAKEDYDHATHFIYVIHGNVTKLMQDNKKMSEELFSLRPLKNKHASKKFKA